MNRFCFSLFINCLVMLCLFQILSPTMLAVSDQRYNIEQSWAYDKTAECPTDGGEQNGATSADISNMQVPPGLAQFGEGADNLKKLFFWVEAKTGVPGALLAAQSYQESSSYWDKSKYDDAAILRHSYMIQGAGKQEVPDSNYNGASGSSSGPMQLDMPGGGNYSPNRLNEFKQAFGVDFPDSPKGNLMFDTAIGYAAIMAKSKTGGADPREYYKDQGNVRGYLSWYGTGDPGGKVWAHYQEWGGADGGKQNGSPQSNLFDLKKFFPKAFAESVGTIPKTTAQIPQEIIDASMALKDQYVQGAQATDVPWQVIAAIHYRESSNDPNKDLQAGNPLGGGGSQYSDAYKGGRPNTIAESAKLAGEELQSKALAGIFKKKISVAALEPDVIKDALYGYNGRNKQYAANSVKYGGQPSTPMSGTPWEGSPYVMSLFDDKHVNMDLVHRDHGPAGQPGDKRFGAFTLFAKLWELDGGATGGGSGECVEQQEQPSSVNGLTPPPNLGPANSQGYYAMPDPSQPPGLYVFNGGTPPRSRCGTKELVSVIYTAAVKWKEKYPDSTLVVGDLNESEGHASHMNGIDVDITTSNRSAANTSGDTNRSIELAKMFIDTGIIDTIGYQDSAVISAIASYAKEKNLPGKVSPWSGHADHFHVRIDAKFKGPSSGSCAG